MERSTPMRDPVIFPSVTRPSLGAPTSLSTSESTLAIIYIYGEYGKGFTVSSVLLAHQILHTALKPYICPRYMKALGMVEADILQEDSHR